MRKTKRTKTARKTTKPSNALHLTWLGCLAAFSAFVAATPFDSILVAENAAITSEPGLIAAYEPAHAQLVSLTDEWTSVGAD